MVTNLFFCGDQLVLYQFVVIFCPKVFIHDLTCRHDTLVKERIFKLEYCGTKYIAKYSGGVGNSIKSQAMLLSY